MEKLAGLVPPVELASPEYFWIAIGFMLLFIFLPLRGKGRGLALDFSFWKKRLQFRSRGVWFLYGLVTVASALMAAVLADPRIVTERRVPIYGRPVMAVVDVSGSMQYVGRAGEELVGFEKAREILYDLLDRDFEADFGLLLYSSENYIARYFAVKWELLQDTLDNSQEVTEIAYGTRTAPALSKARQLLSEGIDGGDKAIVLISDLKESPAGTADMVREMERMSEAGIKLYVIVMGEDDDMWFEDDPRLSKIRATGAEMVGMTDRYGIDRIRKGIGAMARSPIREEKVRSRHSLVPLVLPAALGLVALCLMLSETCFRRIR